MNLKPVIPAVVVISFDEEVTFLQHNSPDWTWLAVEPCGEVALVIRGSLSLTLPGKAESPIGEIFFDLQKLGASHWGST